MQQSEGVGDKVGVGDGGEAGFFVLSGEEDGAEEGEKVLVEVGEGVGFSGVFDAFDAVLLGGHDVAEGRVFFEEAGADEGGG